MVSVWKEDDYEISYLDPVLNVVQQGLAASIIGRAAQKGVLWIDAVNIRGSTIDKHKKTDDYPYGGGAGMLMQARPVYDAWRAVAQERRPRTIYLTPQGKTFTQALARELARGGGACTALRSL